MLRPKTRRQPRGTLLVPTLRPDVAEELAPTLPDEVPVEQALPPPAAEAPAEPARELEPAVFAGEDEPTEDRTAIVTPPPRSTNKDTPMLVRYARPLLFAGLLVGLVFAGLVVGRALRDDDGGSAGPAQSNASTTDASQPPATPPPAQQPAGVKFGPLTATAAGRLAQPAVRAAAVLAGGRLVVLGGSAGEAVQVGKPGGVLRATASLPAPRAGAAAFVSGSSVYFIGGEEGTATPSDEILRYDLATQTVSPAGDFVEPLAGAGYAQAGAAMYLVGGWTGTQYATAVLRFTLPSTAAVVARLPEATRDPAVALRSGTLYVAGGRTVEGLSNTIYAVDLAAGTVALLGHLPHPVAGGALVVAGAKLYLLGGRDGSGPLRDVVAIDTATGESSLAGKMPRPLAGAASVRLGAATYLLGGTRPTAVTRVEAG